MASALRENNENEIIILSDEDDGENTSQSISSVSQTQQANKRKRMKAESDENSDVNSMCMTEKLLIKDDSNSIKEEVQQQVKKQPLSMTNSSNAIRRASTSTNGKSSKINSEDVEPSIENTKKNIYEHDGKFFFINNMNKVRRI